MPSSKPLLTRIGVAAWGGPLVIAVIYFGGIVFALFIALIAAIALFEFYAMAETKHFNPQAMPAILLAVLAIISANFLKAGWWIGLMFALAVLLVFIEIRFGERQALRDVPITIFGWAYIPLLLGLLIYIRCCLFDDARTSWLYMLYFITSIWITDTAAYFGGRALGRHKLAPFVSPKKTWEGAFFGLIGAFLYGWLWTRWLAGTTTRQDLFVVAAIVGVAGQLGDLMESYFKRSAGVKDSGTLLPEHGGALDRFDSLILSTPFVFFYHAAVGRIQLF